MKSLKAMMSQEIGWFDKKENSTGHLAFNLGVFFRKHQICQ